MSLQPSVLKIHLPEWIDHFLAGYPGNFSSIHDRMSFVIEAARRNVSEDTGGPFAAAVFEIESGKLVSLGVNLVTSEGLSILHAEILALALAQKKLGSYDLGSKNVPAHELVTSSEPCAMCLGAIPWSGVRRVIIGARDSDVREIGFDEGAKIEGWRSELNERGIVTLCDVERDAAVQVLRSYSRQGGKIYNSRESG
jgi:tRNA(Arg) A34 adenosine deaminase TadA